MAALDLIGAPSSAGAYAPGQERAPAALRTAGLAERLRDAGADVTDHGDVPGFRWGPDAEHPRAQHASAAAGVATGVAAGVRTAHASGRQALVLGGDCTVGVGTVAGILAAGARPGLVYLDLHADLNTPESTGDGALDWMGVAHLLALNGTHRALAGIGPRVPLLDPDHLVLLGFDPRHATEHERVCISERGIRAIGVDELAADPAAAARSAVAHLADADALVLHFDVDVVDFLDLPLSENVARDGGVSLAAALEAVATIVGESRWAAMTITEVNPDHGTPDGATVRSLAEGLAKTFGITYSRTS
jgi:arginase